MIRLIIKKNPKLKKDYEEIHKKITKEGDLRGWEAKFEFEGNMIMALATTTLYDNKIMGRGRISTITMEILTKRIINV